MKRLLLLATLLAAGLVTAAEAPLRVFIRSGPKSHSPGAHDYPRFLAEWVPLLNARGAKATGADAFPTAAQLSETDVLILHAQEAGNIPDATDRANLEAFIARGGGIVTIHAGAVSRDPDWFKSIVGGSWRQGTTKFLEAPMHLYFTDRQHPIVKDASNWSMSDEIYYDMDVLPESRVLATAYTPKAIDTGGRGNKEAQQRAAEAVATKKAVNIYDIQPQMWTYERTVTGGTKPYRSFVSLPGHFYENFNRPNYRAILLRGIAWAGQRQNADELCRPEELGDTLRYPEGGPTHPSKAAAKIQLHPEFNLSLVASEPLIHKVMNLDWDEKGRLWVCETPEYPNGRRAPNTEPWKDSGSLRGAQVQRDPEDSISILSDTNGDGIMDKRHVFADKLELVTSFVLYKNGVIAACAPDIWFLEDTNGDGVADKRTKLYTGLGINDTHAVINNLRWGLDGWIYASHGYSRGDVTSADGSKNFGPDNSGVVRFKPDGSAFEQFNSKNGNTWGLTVTWDGQVFWTQPTSGTVFFHSVLSEAILEKGKVPGVTSWKGMITNQPSFPLMTWPEQAYVQIDQVGRFTAAAGCAIYEGGAWPEKWNYSYFTSEPTLNIVHHEFVRPEGTSYTVAKEAGREETEFIRSNDLWFRPIEARVGPDGALYIVDFYNQAVIHNDTRGPLHSPANAAVRPDRDHYFSRIWRVQHKEAKKLEVPALDRGNLAALLQTIKTNPNAHVKQVAWRLVQENHGAAGAKALADLNRPMGSKAQQRYEAARTANTPAARQDLLADFISASDDWMRTALIAGASGQPDDYIIAALNTPNGTALAPLVTALIPKVPATGGPRLVQACSTSGTAATAVKLAVLRGLSALSDTPAYLDNVTARHLQQLLQTPDTATAALQLIAKWDRAGTLTASTEPIVRQLVRDFVDPRISDARRAEIAASLLALPKTRADALAEIGRLLSDPATSEKLKNALIAALDNASDADAMLVAAFAKSGSTIIFEHLIKRPESSLALLAAIKDGRIHAADIAPGNLARLRTHPNRRVATEAATVLGPLSPETRQKDELIAKLLPEITKPANSANGRAIFTGACSVCHKFGDIGLRDVGPPLSGIGAKGAAELLTNIVDPNRQVEPNFWQWNITTKKGDTLVGVIATETATSLTLRNQGGDIEVRKDDIVTRDNTKRSLMPEGLEGLGVEELRDVIAFLVSNSPPAAPAAPPTKKGGKANATAKVAAAKPAAAATATSAETPKEGGRNDRPLPPTEPVQWEAGKIKVLVIGGGSSHKFTEFFGTTDGATLRAAGYSVNYTEDRDQAAAELAGADVAVISVNRMFFDMPPYRKALMAFAAAGKGIVMLHPGTWYGYAQWPELNAQIVGGGARGHDKIAKFSVNAVKPAHPVMQGVPTSFDVEDELYYINAEPEKIPPGTAAIDVLAQTSPSVKFGRPHPAVWVTHHDKARVVGITLGHDERVHDHPAFRTLLTNAVKWVSGK